MEQARVPFPKILSRITDPSDGLSSSEVDVASLLGKLVLDSSDLTGRENIFLKRRDVWAMGQRRDTIQNLTRCAFAELEKFLDTPVKHYSSACMSG